MRLSEVLTGIEYDGRYQDCQISQVTCDSRMVDEGSIFVCIKGLKSDGHEHAEQALASGAVAIVAECAVPGGNVLVVKNTRAAYALMCANFYGNPSRGMKLVGVTGTNGKTTITYLLKHILESAGQKVGLIGTIHNEIADITLPAKHTTPDPAQLHAMFRRMAEAGCEYVVMEVSSHALDQHRLDGCRFACGIFTNLTQDHLDYHETMENYFAAKRSFFDLCETAVINLDDPYGRMMAGKLPCPDVTFSAESDTADYVAKEIRLKAEGTRFTFVGNSIIGRVRFCMPGMFSVSNAMASASAMLSCGIPFDSIMEGLNSFEGVSGRTEVLPTKTPFTVIRDYAHSPDGLEKVLMAVRSFCRGRLVTLFGCAGNRDRTKRPKMADIAARLSDFVIITSDNPRNEDPVRIIEDALPGFASYNTPYKVIPDRYEAIEWALKNCYPDDVLVLAGKGHEDYQVLDYGTIYFDEKQIVLSILGLSEEPGRGRQ